MTFALDVRGARVVASGIRILPGDFVTQLDAMLDTSGDVQASLELVVRCLRLGYLHREQAEERMARVLRDEVTAACTDARYVAPDAERLVARRLAVLRRAIA